MLNRKVIATHVTNLTDARYFAARGVDYLLFDLDAISLDKTIEIKEWVEGPEIMLLFSVQSLPLLDEAIIKLSPVAISGKEPGVIAEMIHMSAHVNIFKWEEERFEYDDRDFTLLRSSVQLETLAESDGVVISGSEEEAVGVKAFDMLDEILDQLES